MSKNKENCATCDHWKATGSNYKATDCDWRKALVDSFFKPEENSCNLYVRRGGPKSVELRLMELAREVFEGDTLKQDKNDVLYLATKDENDVMTTVKIFVGSEKRAIELLNCGCGKEVDVK